MITKNPRIVIGEFFTKIYVRFCALLLKKRRQVDKPGYVVAWPSIQDLRCRKPQATYLEQTGSLTFLCGLASDGVYMAPGVTVRTVVS